MTVERELPRVPTGDRAERKRKAIVAAAREVFLRDGFDAGMDHLAEAAGVSKVTVYNHFGSKEALFLAVIGDALDEALGTALTGTEDRLREADTLRDGLIWASREWVAGMARPEVLALRNLVIGELRRFPELGQAWRDRGPGRTGPALAASFGRLVDQGRLDMPDPDLAVLQLFSLVLYPHFVYAGYGDTLAAAQSERLIETGVDMFLAYYRYRPPAG